MNILTVEGVAKSYGTRVLFDDVTFSIDGGQKLGLIGLNGAGKTTLLKIIAGLAEADTGEIWRNPKARIHYLPQEPQFQPGRSVLESVLDGDLPVMDVLRRYEAAVEEDDDEAVLKLTGEMDEKQAWELEQHAKVVLQKLGISDLSQSVDTLSGGQRKRLGLARALILPCDLLIMDEPTNHLDDRTICWLEDYLHDSKSALLLSTHDRYFLDRVAGSMLELDRGKVYTYSGNYAAYLEQRQARLEREEAEAAKRRNLIRRETAWIRRGAQARSTKQKARRDRYEALCAMENGKPIEQNSNPFPAFEGKDLDGNMVKSDELFSGNAVTVVNFWFTTCNPCVGELAELDALNKELAEKGGALIGVNTFTLDGDKAAIADAKDVLAKKGATYQNIYFGSGGDAGKFVENVFAYPTTYVVDRNGNIVGDPIVGAVTGKTQAEALQAQIDKALAADMG